MINSMAAKNITDTAEYHAFLASQFLDDVNIRADARLTGVIEDGPIALRYFLAGYVAASQYRFTIASLDIAASILLDWWETERAQWSGKTLQEWADTF